MGCGSPSRILVSVQIGEYIEIVGKRGSDPQHCLFVVDSAFPFDCWIQLESEARLHGIRKEPVQTDFKFGSNATG